MASPSPAESSALKALMYDSCLFQAHPVIVTNVRDGITDLLRTLGRDDLVALWNDEEKLLHV